MTPRRNLSGAALCAALTMASLVVAVPARAATGEITDPGGDEFSESGAAVTEPRADILGVSFTNSLTEISLKIKVAQVVPFTDPVWNDMFFSATLEDPTGDVKGESYWNTSVDGGTPSGFVGPSLGGAGGGCRTELSQTASTYVLRVTDPNCIAGLPRTLEFGVVAVYAPGDPSGDAAAVDEAPDNDGRAGPVSAAARGTATRVAGTDRILTAVALSQDVFEDGQASAVVLAASMNFPDALAGGPLAWGTSAPMLLTAAGGLDARVRAEIERVLAPGGTVYVLGGTAALSEQVVTDVRGAGFDPQRVAGVNRYATAVAIADTIDRDAELAHRRVLIADGTTFTDALIAAAAAPALGAVVVLTNGSTMPAETAAYLEQDVWDHTAIGTAASTAANVEDFITAENPSALSAAVADELTAIRGSVAVATQTSFADSLAGGPHIAVMGGPLLLTDGQSLSTPARDAIEWSNHLLRKVVVYGGTAAVSAAVLDQIKAVL